MLDDGGGEEYSQFVLVRMDIYLVKHIASALLAKVNNYNHPPHVRNALLSRATKGGRSADYVRSIDYAFKLILHSRIARITCIALIMCSSFFCIAGWCDSRDTWPGTHLIHLALFNFFY